MDLAGRITDVIANNDRTPGLKVGAALRWLETGEDVLVDADLPVPLASVVKVPVLVEATTALWDTIGRIGLAAFEHVRETDSSHGPRGRH